jgi:hypothetical protein
MSAARKTINFVGKDWFIAHKTSYLDGGLAFVPEKKYYVRGEGTKMVIIGKFAKASKIAMGMVRISPKDCGGCFQYVRA